MNFNVNNLPKLVIAILAMLCGLVILILTFTGVVLQDFRTEAYLLGSQLLSGPAWYILGNGVASKNGTVSSPIISPKDNSTNV